MVKTLVVVPLSIDPEFQAVCPSLSEDEYAGLRESILSEGCRDAVCYWENSPDGANPIVDGIHRYDICHNEGIECPTRPMRFADRHAIKCWILRNQLGRRNLTDTQRSILRGQLYNELKGPHGGDHTSAKAKGQNVHLLDAAEQIAAKDGISSKTVRREGELAEAVAAIIEKAPELKEPIERGVISKGDVSKLANATPHVLKRLTTNAKNPKKLRQAVKQASSANRRSGKPVNRAKWKDLEDLLGKALLKADDLNKVEPHSNLHRMIIGDIKQAMGHLNEWKRSKVA